MKTSKLNQKKIQKQIARLSELAAKNMWKYLYDPELDELYYSPESIPNDSILISIGDEFSIYVNKKSEVNGIFIEYFTSNYAEHEEVAKTVKALFNKKFDGYKTVSSRDQKKLQSFNNVIRGEILSQLAEGDLLEIPVNDNSSSVASPY